MNTRRQKIISLTIAFIYVGLGTLWVLTSHGADPYYFDWPLAILLTLPVVVISFAIRFGVENYLLPLLITQAIIFISVYLSILRFYIKKK